MAEFDKRKKYKLRVWRFDTDVQEWVLYTVITLTGTKARQQTKVYKANGFKVESLGEVGEAHKNPLDTDAQSITLYKGGPR